MAGSYARLFHIIYRFSAQISPAFLRPKMNPILLDYLFSRRVLVSAGGQAQPHSPETILALSALFGVEITRGAYLAEPEMIRQCQRSLGEEVPEPFYRGFPQSVRQLTADQLLFDQLIHYTRTYGLGDFSRPGHSLLEGRTDMSGPELIGAVMAELRGDEEALARLTRPGALKRGALEERGERRDFVIVTEAEARKTLLESAEAFLLSTRPLSLSQTEVLKACVRELGLKPEHCGSKDTAIALMLDGMDPAYGRFLRLPDVMDLADAARALCVQEAAGAPEESGPAFAEVSQAGQKNNQSLRRLNLPNRHRRLLTRVLNRMFERGVPEKDIRACYARQGLWCGLLHHLHYQPEQEAARRFVEGIRSGANRSPEAAFEDALRREGPGRAAALLAEERGSGAVARRLDYLLRHCEEGREDRAEAVLAHLEGVQPLLLIQLLIHYSQEIPGPRSFRFTHQHRLITHVETAEEMARRRQPSEGMRRLARQRVEEGLKKTLAGRLGRVYIDPEMARLALPLQETAAMGGIGVLPRGSRIPLDLSQTLRGFTYWEKVDDIDLSVIGLDEQAGQVEFSWRTTGWDGEPIVYSGDETAGYNGGAEYFDVDVKAFRQAYPNLRYLVFCDNIFTDGVTFDQCVCRAGWMVRQQPLSGEVFEPKTVRSAFPVKGSGRFACLFGVDLQREDFVWLNVLRASASAVAGATSLGFLLPWMGVTDVMNVERFFAMMARERVYDPARAEVIVTDRPVSVPQGARVIHSWDYEQILTYLNMD